MTPGTLYALFAFLGFIAFLDFVRAWRGENPNRD